MEPVLQTGVTSLGKFTEQRGDPGHRHEALAVTEAVTPAAEAIRRTPSTSTHEANLQHQALAQLEP